MSPAKVHPQLSWGSSSFLACSHGPCMHIVLWILHLEFKMRRMSCTSFAGGVSLKPSHVRIFWLFIVFTLCSILRWSFYLAFTDVQDNNTCRCFWCLSWMRHDNDSFWPSREVHIPPVLLRRSWVTQYPHVISRSPVHRSFRLGLCLMDIKQFFTY